MCSKIFGLIVTKEYFKIHYPYNITCSKINVSFQYLKFEQHCLFIFIVLLYKTFICDLYFLFIPNKL